MVDAGQVVLVDVMGDDAAIVEAARQSYTKGTKSPDRDLIRYMLRHHHGTPFEAVVFKLQVRCPIFTARQLMRHRISSVSEMSARYSEMQDDFYEGTLRRQSSVNKQGSDDWDGGEQERLDLESEIAKHNQDTYQLYQRQLKAGVAKEIARSVLPVSVFTQFQWTLNLRSLMNFCGLRSDSHAQQEIRVISDQLVAIATTVCPLAIEAWNDYDSLRGAVTLSRLELLALAQGLRCGEIPELDSLNKRECLEWQEKVAVLLRGHKEH